MTTENSIAPVIPCFGASGITKRELFAALAMQGLLANPRVDEQAAKEFRQAVAFSAIGHADALLAELNK